MNNPFWDKTITIYTKFYDSDTKTTKWYRYVCDKCFYSSKDVNVLKGLDIANQNINVARIPCDSSYLAYKDWCSCDDKESHLSITKGSLIFNGSIDENIQDNSSGNELLKQYANQCFKVSIFKQNDTYMLKHYYAGGE